MLTKAMLRLERVPTIKIGAILLVTAVIAGLLLFQKQRLATMMTPGETVVADFQRDYRLRAYVTKVKVAGVPVGVVTDVEHDVDGATRVTMKVDDQAVARLRSTPSAAIRPTTLLGGNYYVALKPGGDPGKPSEAIPTTRTTTPVELDRVLEVLRPEARTSLQRTVRRLDSTLGNGGSRQLDELLAEAPKTLRPAAPVLFALRGLSPQSDLNGLVRDLGGAARALTSNRGELESALSGMHTSSAVLDKHKDALAEAVATLPGTLRTARTGLRSLDGTLAELEATSAVARPMARELDALLDELEPALAAARPVVRDLKPTLRNLRPAVDDLRPSVTTATGVLNDIDGPVLGRVNGQLMDMLKSPWKGAGPHEGDGNDTPLYIELGNFIAGMNNASRMTDRNGATIHFHPGVGIGSVLNNTPIGFEKLVNELIAPGGAE